MNLFIQMDLIGELHYTNIFNKSNEEDYFNDEIYKEIISQEEFPVCSNPTAENIIYKYAKDQVENDDQKGEQYPWFDPEKIHSNPKCTIL